nr:MAG TPA: hypothetical protein [Caudoviricetes sp.]
MALTRDEYVELLKHISETGGDTDDMLEALKRLQDDFDEREGMLRELGESRDKETYTNDDVFDKDGVKWSEKYDDMRRRYRDRFFTTGTAVIEAQEDDIEKDSDSTKMSYDDLFEDREGDYKGE